MGGWGTVRDQKEEGEKGGEMGYWGLLSIQLFAVPWGTRAPEYSSKELPSLHPSPTSLLLALDSSPVPNPETQLTEHSHSGAENSSHPRQEGNQSLD